MGPFLVKYNTAIHVYIPMVKRAVVDFAVGADWTPATGDVEVSIDGGAVANVGTLPVAIAAGNGAFWDFVFTGGEVTGKKVVVTIVDAATKAVEDNMFEMYTYGHASAEYPIDLSDLVRMGLTALPNAAAEASGGLATLSAAQASNGTIQSNVHRWLTGTPNALTSGRVDSIVGAVTAGVIAAASFAANALDAVWSTATRILTAGTNIVLAKGTGVTGFNDIPAGTAMTSDLTQTVPTSNTAQTLGDCLNAARAQGFGKWTLVGTLLKLYANDGTTVIRTFTLDDATNPTSRT